MRRQIQNFPVYPSIASAKKTCQILSRKLCILRRHWLRYISAFCQGLWFGFLTVDTTYSTYIIFFTYNTFIQEKQRAIFLPLIVFSFFVSPCYNRRTHYYPTLEKPGTQNIIARENQGKQRELSDHWEKKQCFFKKNNRGWRKKDKNINLSTGFNKTFYQESLTKRK